MPVIEEVRTVTANGRVVVPWTIQRALGLDHGGSVQFRVEDGVVTLRAVEVHQAPAEATVDGAGPRRTDVRWALAAELKTILDAAERDRANEAATW